MVTAGLMGPPWVGGALGARKHRYRVLPSIMAKVRHPRVV